jgi:hypothetical protein
MGVQAEFLSARNRLEGEQQQKTNEFPRRFILFERHLFAARF